MSIARASYSSDSALRERDVTGCGEGGSEVVEAEPVTAKKKLASFVFKPTT